MTYSRRMARVLNQLKATMSITGFVQLLNRMVAVTAFEDLSKEDQKIIAEAESKLIQIDE